MSETSVKSAADSAVKAATEFKYLLDVQPALSLFNPGGIGDARDSASYARAARLLNEAVAQSDNSRVRPGSVLGRGVPVVDFVANAGSQTPPQTLDILQRVRVALLSLGLNECDQGSRGGENSGLLEIRIRTSGQADQVLEFSQGMGNAVHSTTPQKVDEEPLCHGRSANNQGGC